MQHPTPTAMPLIAPLPLLDSILEPWKSTIGPDYEGYKNHCTRMAHCCFALRDCTEEERRKITIAAAHHDIGIWTNSTVDYLPPSIAQARQYLADNRLTHWMDEIVQMIDLHHQFRAVKDGQYPLVEVFRQGDLVDFSMGLIRFGIARTTVKAIKMQFPNAGFHKRLMQLAGGWFARHPLSPPPFMKW